jgi:predicted pyridoxine 5'-phosphate oxidase superfamily flavin-nucleotide-binding protein
MKAPINAPADSPWHAGELAIQDSVGAVRAMDKPGRLYVRNFLLDQHRTFYPLLHFIVLGAVDPQGDAFSRPTPRPWSCVPRAMPQTPPNAA